MIINDLTDLAAYLKRHPQTKTSREQRRLGWLLKWELNGVVLIDGINDIGTVWQKFVICPASGATPVSCAQHSGKWGPCWRRVLWLAAQQLSMPPLESYLAPDWPDKDDDRETPMEGYPSYYREPGAVDR